MDPGFHFQTGEVILAEWTDKLFYAKILHIDYIERMCTLLFDDDSVEHCPFSKIHSVTETTAEIVCIVCKDGASSSPNEIVLCDKCGIGYHQKCHDPFIEDKALEPEAPWMCVYCSNATECPYLLNPFETKLQKNHLSSMSVRKSREDTKDNHYIGNHSSGFIRGKPSRVTNLMANYYHDTYQRRPADTSHARHVTSEHHVRRAMMDHQGPRNKYYKFPDDKTNQRVGQDSFSRKRRLGQQRTSQDDNGYNDDVTRSDVTSDVSKSDVTGSDDTRSDIRKSDVTGSDVTDDVSKLKAAGKDGPREKQRLTQDLERQRKKLKEDMKRGQELQREHNQLLTRDSTYDTPRDVTYTPHDHTAEEVPTDDDSWRSYEAGDLSRKHDRRVYASGHNGTAEYSDNVRNTFGKRACGDSADDGYKSKHFRINGSGPDDESEGLKIQLDPCNCDNTAQEPGTSEHVHKMSDMQCEHSSSRDTSHEVNGHAENAREVHEHEERLYSSEKIEVLGESNDLGGYNETFEKERVQKHKKSNKGKTNEYHDEMFSGHDGSRYETSSRGQADRNKVKTERGNGYKHQKSSGGKTTEAHEYHKKERRTKEGSNGRCGSVKSDKESLKESSSGHKRNSCSDESTDNEASKTRNKTPQDGGNKKHEFESAATQNRVRSVLPRHNWLVERWINQKNPPVGSDSSRRTSIEGLKDTQVATSINSTVLSTSPVFEEKYKDEVLDEGYTTKINSDDDTDSGSVASQNENSILKVPSPVKYENEPLIENSPNYSPPKQDSPRSSRDCSPEIKQYSSTNRVPAPSSGIPVSPNRLPATASCIPSPNRISTTTSGNPISPNRLSNSIPSPNRIASSGIPVSPNRLPATTSCIPSPNRIITTTSGNPVSPNRLPATTSCDSTSLRRFSVTTTADPTSPNRLSISTNCLPASPNRVPASPNRIPPSPSKVSASPQRVPASSNCIPPSPKQVPSSPNTVPPSPNRIPVSPKRPSPCAPQIEARQISPRFPTEQELGGNQEQSRTKWDTTGGNKEHNDHFHQGKVTSREIPSGEKIIEVSSDGEENKRGNLEENKEVSKIQTGRSVNPVSPIVRADKHVMDETHPGIHEPRKQSLKPLHVPAELPQGLPFMSSAYVPGYSPRNFTPHLITHSAAGMSAPASQIMRHPGHPALQGRFPGRLELAQHTKPDMNCPFHGKKVEKMIPHVPGYPVIHGDAHMFPQHALHDGMAEAALKARDKRSEHAEFHPDALAMQRRLSTVYDRHLVMPHGIHMHHPRYLAQGLIDEHGFSIDSERYKHRLEAAHAYTAIHKPRGGDEHTGTSRYTEEEKRALKYMEDKRDTQKDIVMQSERYRQHHREPSPMTSEAHRKDMMKRYNISPQEARSARDQHVVRTRPESPVKTGKYSPAAVRHVTPKENHPGFIQLGERKMSKEKPGPECSSFRPSPSPSTLYGESISRDFNERFNMLDKTFKEKLEGTDRSKEEAMAAHRRHGFEEQTRAWGENQAKDALKYRNVEKHSPGAKHSPPSQDEQRKLVSPRGLVTSSTHKPTMPMPSYSFPGSLVPSSQHGPAGFGRGMVGVPIMANRGEYAVWQGMRGPGRIPGYPNVTMATKDIQGLSAEKSERAKADYATTVKREYQEKEMSLAFEKHRMNVAQLESERRKAFMATKSERVDERRPENGEHEQRSPRMREEELRRNWELESRKRKLESMQAEAKLSPHARAPIAHDKRMQPDKTHIADESTLLRKEHYLAMYARQHDPYGQHIQGVPYIDRARSAGNPAFYMGRMDAQRGQAEQSVNEALRKQREFNERQEAMRKMASQERDLGTSGEPAKKRAKNQRCMCGVCGKEASFLCSGCQKAWYCSAKCQHTAWADHCKDCTETKRR